MRPHGGDGLTTRRDPPLRCSARTSCRRTAEAFLRVSPFLKRRRRGGNPIRGLSCRLARLPGDWGWQRAGAPLPGFADSVLPVSLLLGR